MPRWFFATLVGVVCSAVCAVADPLSKKTDVDFFRDVPSRNLKGLATRSDGRLVGGPTLTEIAAPPPADLLWCLEPGGEPGKFLVGTGPDGRIIEITYNPANNTFTTVEIAKLQDPQVFTLKRLADGAIVAGTSPKGALYLIREGRTVARALLPVDSIFDLLLVDRDTLLVGTGNPGRIYKVDLGKFATAGLAGEKLTDAKALAGRGISIFGEIRDRNVRRLAAYPDGRIVAGSAPKGNIYTFAQAGGAAFILQENREAEVTDLLTQPNGDLFATIVFSATTGESRLSPPARRPPTAPPERDSTEASPPPLQVDKFAGRSTLVLFPANGFAETLASRSSVAFYRLARFEDTLLLAGGDTGELLGFDLRSRFSLTFPGSASAQLNAIAPLAGTPGKFLVLRNNTPGLALLDFTASGPREAETRRIELGTPSQLGAVRFNRLRGIAPEKVSVEARINNGTDEVEGWGPWTDLRLDQDGGWRGANLRGRSTRLRITLPGAGAGSSGTAASSLGGHVELDRAAIFALPQNRRPQLQDFRVLAPGYGLVVSPEQPASPIVSISQLLQAGTREDDKRHPGAPSGQVVPQPGTQVVFWTVTDADGDALSCTFSLRRDGDPEWTDLVTNTSDSYAQFDTAHLPDGVYFTRLVARETAPRPVADRLTHTFETDDLIVDHTPPEILASQASRSGDSVLVTLRGRDQLSLLEGIEIVFSNGVRETIEQPADGVRDGREETFTFDVPVARVSNATSVEVTLYDAAGNSTARRLTWAAATR